MSKSKPERNLVGTDNARSGGEYDVGYGRPPKAHRFKPGQSGNPKGRPKGAQSEATILRDILHERIEVQQAGRSRKISTLKALLLRCRNAALGGDLKSLAFLLNRLRLFEGNQPGAEDALDQDDRVILETFAQELKVEFMKTKE